MALDGIRIEIETKRRLIHTQESEAPMFFLLFLVIVGGLLGGLHWLAAEVERRRQAKAELSAPPPPPTALDDVYAALDEKFAPHAHRAAKRKHRTHHDT